MRRDSIFKTLNIYSFKLLLLWILVLSVLYSTLSVIRHDHFQSGGFDLGIYDQAIWQYSRFLYPYNTVKERFILGDHLTLNLPLLAPLLYVWNDARILLIAQAVWISLSALPIYLLARQRKFIPLHALIFAVVYSLFYGIQYGVFFDFHPIIFAVGLLSWLVYFLEARKIRALILTIILLLTTQENTGFALAGLGLIYIWKREFRKTALMFLAVGVIYSLLAMRLTATFSPVGYEYKPQISFNPVTNMTRLFDSAEKRQVWLYSFSGFAFLPLFSPGALLAVAGDLAQYFVTGPEFFPMWSIYKHHRAILAVFLILGTMDAIAFLNRKKVNIHILMGILAFSVLANQFVLHLPLNKLSKRVYWQKESWITDTNALLNRVPPSASIVAQQSLVPHVTHRNTIYLAWPRQHDFSQKPCGRVTCWWLDFTGNPRYLILDLHPGSWVTQLLETPEHVHEAVQTMESMGKIRPLMQIGDAYIFEILSTASGVLR